MSAQAGRVNEAQEPARPSHIRRTVRAYFNLTTPTNPQRGKLMKIVGTDLEGELYDRAVRAARRAAGCGFQQPSPWASEVMEDGTVILRSVCGEICRYAYDAKRNRLSYVSK
jgi:hypothetical protein